MLRRTLSLGILAHVDAGKTTLTERLLYTAGVIDAPGSVDAGTTRTDTLALERRRGITIKAAVVSFAIDDVTVNLVDTPGHPDFIAEVDRALAVLDAAVLVVSAVEGVQPQTRLLMRALQRLCLPTLLFVNKIDRLGADAARVLQEISRKLTSANVALTEATGEGTPNAQVMRRDSRAFAAELVDLLAEHDDTLLGAYVDDEASVSRQRLLDELSTQTRQALVFPVLCGSALTGAGIDELMSGVTRLLPARVPDPDGGLSATVFKIERGAGGDKAAYVRLFRGTLRIRDSVRIGHDRHGKVTALYAFADGAVVQRASVVAGEIAKVRGLADARIGDTIGEVAAHRMRRAFQPPTLESVASAVDSTKDRELKAALGQLAEQDPLINVRWDDARHETTVSLYGQVQLEVLQATLLDDYGIDVEFRELTPIFVERPLASGEAVEILHADANPYLATIALRIEPARPESGIAVRLAVDARDVPLYVYKTLDSFREHMEAYVRAALREGLHGWEVTDCVVTMTECAYSVPDGPPSRRGPLSTAADFRKLTPIVLRQALAQARTVVCEPTVLTALEVPTATVGAVVPALTRLGGEIERQLAHGELSTVDAVMSAQAADELRRLLPKLTGGEGVVDSAFAGYRPLGRTVQKRGRVA